MTAPARPESAEARPAPRRGVEERVPPRPRSLETALEVLAEVGVPEERVKTESHG